MPDSDAVSEYRIDCGIDVPRSVFILWRDAHADGGSSWLRIEDIEDTPYIVRSNGFLLDEVKKDHISIAQSFGAEDGTVDYVLHIPIEMIVWIYYFDMPVLPTHLGIEKET